jgi:hypothetical protein
MFGKKVKLGAFIGHYDLRYNYNRNIDNLIPNHLTSPREATAMARELPKDQTKNGIFTNRQFRGDWHNDKIQKMIKDGKVCPVHHMVLNGHGKCPVCGSEYKTKG